MENYIVTRRGRVPLDQATAAERRALVRNIYLAFARALAPEGVDIRCEADQGSEHLPGRGGQA